MLRPAGAFGGSHVVVGGRRRGELIDLNDKRRHEQ